MVVIECQRDAVPRHRVDLVTPDRATNNLRAQRMERMVVEVSFGCMKRFHAWVWVWVWVVT